MGCVGGSVGSENKGQNEKKSDKLFVTDQLNFLWLWNAICYYTLGRDKGIYRHSLDSSVPSKYEICAESQEIIVTPREVTSFIVRMGVS